MYDLILPTGTQGILTEPRSEQAGSQAGKYSACSACVNDTYPDFFRDPSLPWSNLIRPTGFSMLQRPSVNLQLHSYVHWEDEPPFSSPFGACTSVLFLWIFIIHYFRLQRSFTLYQMSWISATMAVVPLCSHLSDRNTLSKLLQCQAQGLSHVIRASNRVSHRVTSLLPKIRWLRLVLSLLVFFLYLEWDPGPLGFSWPITHHYWRPPSIWSGCRVGEAAHPGPHISIATLNVASLCMHQDEVTVSREIPTLMLFTETCLTEHVYRTVQGKARRHRKFLVPGGICAPRKSAHKSDSHARGESGGILVCSDMPARNGNIPFDQMTWLSNRVVESIVSLPTGLTIRVVGICGYSKRYPGHIELTNQLLSACLKFVSQSTIPCVFLGDFNCELQELSSWKMLQDRGWVDSALLQSSRDGRPPLPTWKSYSRIDYILLPRSLVPYFHLYKNEPDTVSDYFAGHPDLS